MFIEKFNLQTRVALLGSLGMSAWLIAFARILKYESENPTPEAHWMIGLALLNGALLLVNTFAQFRIMQRDQMQWFINNYDVICWLSLIGAYTSVLLIERMWQPGTLDLFLLSFMIVIHSIHTIRFSAPVSVITLLVPAVLYGWQVGGEVGVYLTLFIANQKLVLWGLGLGVLRELLEAGKLKEKTAQLTLAQARLEELSRQEERRKIRQDLHDKMGHELAAMNINLQLLEHLYPASESQERETLNQTQDACQRLFSTLGDVVGELKRHANEDFYDQLTQMIDRVPGLDIQLNADERIRIQDSVVADNLLCCIQEGLTNILKHSKATKAEIELHSDGGGMWVTITDNGQTIQRFKSGNGLTGIQTRMERIGGHADIGCSEPGGFRIALNLPREAMI